MLFVDVCHHMLGVRNRIVDIQEEGGLAVLLESLGRRLGFDGLDDHVFNELVDEDEAVVLIAAEPNSEVGGTCSFQVLAAETSGASQ